MRLAENTGHKKSPKSRHLRTIAQPYWTISSQLKHVSTIGKKLGKQQCLLHMSSQFGELTAHWLRSVSDFGAEIVSLVWGTPANFNFDGFRVLAASLHGTLVVGVTQTFWCSTEGATCIWQGGHHVGHWPTF